MNVCKLGFSWKRSLKYRRINRQKYRGDISIEFFVVPFLLAYSIWLEDETDKDNMFRTITFHHLSNQTFEFVEKEAIIEDKIDI